MISLIGVQRKSGTYEGHEYDNVILHCLNDNPNVPTICGEACEVVKVKARQVRDVFGGLVTNDSEWRELIGKHLSISYDRYANPQKIEIID